jgi:hypothetical protein
LGRQLVPSRLSPVISPLLHIETAAIDDFGTTADVRNFTAVSFDIIARYRVSACCRRAKAKKKNG